MSVTIPKEKSSVTVTVHINGEETQQNSSPHGQSAAPSKTVVTVTQSNERDIDSGRRSTGRQSSRGVAGRQSSRSVGRNSSRGRQSSRSRQSSKSRQSNGRASSRSVSKARNKRLNEVKNQGREDSLDSLKTPSPAKLLFPRQPTMTELFTSDDESRKSMKYDDIDVKSIRSNLSVEKNNKPKEVSWSDRSTVRDHSILSESTLVPNSDADYLSEHGSAIKSHRKELSAIMSPGNDLKRNTSNTTSDNQGDKDGTKVAETSTTVNDSHQNTVNETPVINGANSKQLPSVTPSNGEISSRSYKTADGTLSMSIPDYQTTLQEDTSVTDTDLVI